MAQGDPPQQGYFLGLHNSVENPWISRKNWENVTSPPENDSTGMNNSESSYPGEVLSLPVMSVSIDDIIGEQNEVESEPPVVRSINEDTGECSEQYEQNDDNIFSAFNRVDSRTESVATMEQSLRDYCYDKTVEMFQPKVGMTFD